MPTWLKRILLMIVLSFFSVITASPTLPITLTWGTPNWGNSSTHAVVPLIITIEKDWKFYGPPQKGDTLKRPPELSWSLSKNIADVSADWPIATFWQDQEQKAHVYCEQVIVPINVLLKNRNPANLAITFEGLACSKLCMPIKITTQLQLTPPVTTVFTLIKMLFFAFLGGIILNAMPCVLPVLGLKFRSLTHQSRDLLKKVCLFTSLGIVATFWLLAMAIILLKSLFHIHISWGAQLQNPYFLSLMCLIMIFGAYNLLGVFHLNPPQWAGQNRFKASGVITTSFVSGMLAVLLATPCSAPFLGPAVGFALTGSNIEILSFYTAIACGFALPYLLGLFLPIGKLLPKPGPWMVKIERSLGMLFFLSAAWFIGWSLPPFLSPILQNLTWIFFVVWVTIPFLRLLFNVQILSAKKRQFIFYVLPVTMGVAFILFPLFSPHGTAMSMVDGNIHWVAWSPKQLEETLQSGRTVFVDVTGGACALCVVNKRVFLSPKIQKLLTSKKVVCMRADYSKGDTQILKFLKRYERAAIPFNIVLNKNYPSGIVLSEILSEDELSKALDLIQNRFDSKGSYNLQSISIPK